MVTGSGWLASGRVVHPLTMKPAAPTLVADDITTETPSLETEMRRVCEEQAPHSRITIPAPPTEEALRLATPVPPPDS